MALSSNLNIAFYYIAFHTILGSVCVDSLGFTLRLIPAFSPESPLYPGNLTVQQKINKAIEISIARVHYLNSEASQNYKPDTIRLPVDRYRGYYVVELSIGTPPKRQVLLMDTGSGMTWTQCTPCINCFKQTTPFFHPNQSHTYQKIPCSDSVCAFPFRCVNGECKYEVKYGGGASTTGLVSTETFTVENERGVSSTIPGMIFGCGNDNKKITFSNGTMSGILGFNNFRRSFVRQMFHVIQGRFSYCLAFGEAQTTTSFLKFGEDIKMPTKDVKTTFIVKQNISNNNFLNLEDISVGDRRLRFAPGTFALKSNGSGGCLMDTGSPTTFLEDGPYNAVMMHFDEHFKSFGAERVHDRSIKMEYCYRYVKVKPTKSCISFYHFHKEFLE